MKTKKLTLVTFLAVLMLVFVSVFAINFNSKKANAAIEQTEYAKVMAVNGGTDMLNSEGVFQIDPFTSDPHTFESLVYLYGGNNWNGVGREGAIIGGYDVGDEHVNIEITDFGKIRFYWKFGNIDWKTNDVVVSTHLWTHIVVVRDSSADAIKCYVNGVEVAGTYSRGSGIGSDFTNFNVKHWIGRDGRPWQYFNSDGTVASNPRNNYFNGQINYVGVSSESKTSADVSNAYKAKTRLINSNDSGVLCSKELGVRTYYRAKNAITEVPYTYTATINIPQGTDNFHQYNNDTDNIAQIFSTFAGAYSYHNIEMAVNRNGNIRFSMDYEGWHWDRITAVFDRNLNFEQDASLDVRTGQDVHVAVVRDDQEQTFKLYLNGVHVSNASYYIYEYNNGTEVTSAYSHHNGGSPVIKGPYKSIYEVVGGTTPGGTTYNVSYTWGGLSNTLNSTVISKKAFELYDRLKLNVWGEGKINFTPPYSFGIGKDLVSGGGSFSKPFPGKIYDVAIYSNVIDTAAEYSVTDKTTINATKAGYESVLVNWVFDENQENLILNKNHTQDLKDYSGNGNDAFLCTVGGYTIPESDNWFEAGEDEYTIIYVPDTQCTVRTQPDYTRALFDWISNKDNIDKMNLQFVMGLGDIIDGINMTAVTTPADQWDIMRDQYQKLTDAGIYWSAITGNHDYDVDGCPIPSDVRQANIFNEHFGYNTLSQNEKATIVGRFSTNYLTTGVSLPSTNTTNNDMLNVIYEYTATTNRGEQVKYLVVALEFGPSIDTLNWASSIISKPEYANHRVLFNSHNLVFSDGAFGDSTATNNSSVYWKNLSGNNKAVDGQQIWDEYLYNHSNIFLTACGHIESDTLMRRTDTGVNGNNVMSILCDGQGVSFYSNTDSPVSGKGDPLVLVAKVNEKTKTIKYNYYNPVNNMMFAIENQFEYDFSNWDTATRYNVEKSADINYDLDNAKANSIVEFTINETAGYAYNTPVVTSNGQTLTLTQNGDVYSFIMPKDAVSISVDKLNLNNYTMPSSLTITVGESTDLSSYLPTTEGVEITFNNANVTASGTEITAVNSGKSLMTITFTEFDVVKTCGITIQKATTSSSSSSSSVKPSSSASSSSKVESSSSSSSSSQQVTSSSQPEQSSPTRAERSAGCGANFTGTGLFIVLAVLSVGIFLLKKKHN